MDSLTQAHQHSYKTLTSWYVHSVALLRVSKHVFFVPSIWVGMRWFSFQTPSRGCFTLTDWCYWAALWISMPFSLSVLCCCYFSTQLAASAWRRVSFTHSFVDRSQCSRNLYTRRVEDWHTLANVCRGFVQASNSRRYINGAELFDVCCCFGTV